MSLAATSLNAATAGVAPCTPVHVEHPTDALPLSWSRALYALGEAVSVRGQAWSCGGGTLALSVDASSRSGMLTFVDTDGRQVQRRIPRAEDLVPSAKALLAIPEPDVVAPPKASGASESPLQDSTNPAAAGTREPRFFVDVLGGVRYRRPENAIWTAATLRAMIPFGAWSGGFWIRGAVPTLLERDREGEWRIHTTSEATLGLSAGRRLFTGAFALDVTLDPSLTFAFEPGLPMPPNPLNNNNKSRTALSVRINPQIGIGVRGTFAIAGPIRGAVALDGEFLPDTIGGGVSLGVEAVIR